MKVGYSIKVSADEALGVPETAAVVLELNTLYATVNCADSGEVCYVHLTPCADGTYPIFYMYP